ncbi:MAG TPA: hypothetical protein VFZ75_10850 [Actinomycetota bacterium]|nr:hypothetical protein [Actinomycetota bacterium]
MSPLRWIIVILLVVALVGLLAFARGREHRRGDEEGALGAPVPVVRVGV